MLRDELGSAAASQNAAAPAQQPPLLPLYTPAEAAGLLAVPESWIRRRATARLVPCTFLGKHLRFSPADLAAIAAAGAYPPGQAALARRVRHRSDRARDGR